MYLEHWHIQSPGVFQNPSIFRTMSNTAMKRFRENSVAIIIFITSTFQILYFMKKNMIL